MKRNIDLTTAIQLFDGEDIKSHIDGEFSNVTASEAEINEKYIKGDVRIVTEQARYPLTQIPLMIESGNYERNPEFQRRHRWNNVKKSRLIESFIMNVPVPPIFLYEDRYSHYEVMDGLQRLTAIDDFYKGTFVLEDLEYWPELNGYSYATLPEQVRRGIDRRYLSSIILLQETAKNEEEAAFLKQVVFERINSGGVKLEYQEARNAVYNGPLNRLCIRLARNTNLCKTWGIPEPDINEIDGNVVREEVLQNELYRTMTDVELVLRFFAYRQRLHNHKGALKSYLDKYQAAGNKFSDETLGKLEHLFVDTIDLAYSLLDSKAFWLVRKRGGASSWFKRSTTVVYDPIMYVLSQLLDKRDALLSRRIDIRDGIFTFYENNYEKFEGRYTNLSNIGERNELYIQFFSRYL